MQDGMRKQGPDLRAVPCMLAATMLGLAVDVFRKDRAPRESSETSSVSHPFSDCVHSTARRQCSRTESHVRQ